MSSSRKEGALRCWQGQLPPAGTKGWHSQAHWASFFGLQLPRCPSQELPLRQARWGKEEKVLPLRTMLTGMGLPEEWTLRGLRRNLQCKEYFAITSRELPAPPPPALWRLHACRTPAQGVLWVLIPTRCFKTSVFSLTQSHTLTRRWIFSPSELFFFFNCSWFTILF